MNQLNEERIAIPAMVVNSNAFIHFEEKKQILVSKLCFMENISSFMITVVNTLVIA